MKIEFEEEAHKDARSYVERMFFNVVDGQMVPKNIGYDDCSEGPPETLPDDKICILSDYKKNIKRGRKDPLKGQNVLAIPSDKGHVLIPFEEAIRYANLIYSAAISAQRLFEEADEDSPDSK